MATLPYMKMTMHIDDQLLDRVVRLTGADSRTEAVDMALREMDRRSRLAEFGRNGLGLTPAELMEAVTPGYDVLEIREREVSASYSGRVREDQPPLSRPMTYREFARSRRKA
jgi:hypothetical protein